MNHNIHQNKSFNYDDRRDIAIPGDLPATLKFCAEHFIASANAAIQDHDYFAVALAGGSTPKAVYEILTSQEYADRINWSKVRLFWGDERAVPPSHADSNYRMAMQAGFDRMPLLPAHIHRMKAEEDIEQGALEYEQFIKKSLLDSAFDLVLLGLGEDGHTASLFPQTHALHVENRLVVSNYVPKLNAWRMTLTFDCINAARQRAFYVLGKSKASIVKTVLNGHSQPDLYPAQRVGIQSHKALWILDADAAGALPIFNGK